MERPGWSDQRRQHPLCVSYPSSPVVPTLSA
jgi:hypothetical protein